MNDITAVGNLAEAGLWAIFAFTFAILAARASGPLRQLWIVESIAFFAFGISDVIESQTGAWWTPPSLLLLKAGCLAVFVYGIVKYRRLSTNHAPAVESSRSLREDKSTQSD